MDELGISFLLLILSVSIFAIVFELFILRSLPSLILIAFLIQNLFLTTGVLLFASPSLFPSDRLLFWKGEPSDLIIPAILILIFNVIFYVTATALLCLVNQKNRVIKFKLEGDVALTERSWLIILLAAMSPIGKFLQIQAGFKHYYNAGTLLETNTNPFNMILSLAGSFGLLGLALLFYLVLLKKNIHFFVIFVVLLGSYFYFASAGAGVNVFINILFLFIFSWFYVNSSGRRAALRFFSASMVSVLVVVSALVLKIILRRNEKVYDDGVVLGLANTFRASTPSVENLFVIWKSGQAANLNGETLALIPKSIIPRFIWPDKPEIALSTWFHDDIWRTPLEMTLIPAGKQGNALYIYSEGMLNFGVAGVLFFAVLYGLILFTLTYFLAKKNFLTPGFRFAFLCTIAYDLLVPGLTMAYLISSVAKSLIILGMVYFAVTLSVQLRVEDRGIGVSDKPL